VQVFVAFLQKHSLACLSPVTVRATGVWPFDRYTQRSAALLKLSLPCRVAARFPRLSRKELACFLDHPVTPIPNEAPVRAYHYSLPYLCCSLQAQISQSRAFPARLETNRHLLLQPLSGHFAASTFGISGRSGF